MSDSGDSFDSRFEFDAPGEFDFAKEGTNEHVDDDYFDPERRSNPDLSDSYLRSEDNMQFLRQFSDEIASDFAKVLQSSEGNRDENARPEAQDELGASFDQESNCDSFQGSASPALRSFSSGSSPVLASPLRSPSFARRMAMMPTPQRQAVRTSLSPEMHALQENEDEEEEEEPVSGGKGDHVVAEETEAPGATEEFAPQPAVAEKDVSTAVSDDQPVAAAEGTEVTEESSQLEATKDTKALTVAAPAKVLQPALRALQRSRGSEVPLDTSNSTRGPCYSPKTSVTVVPRGDGVTENGDDLLDESSCFFSPNMEPEGDVDGSALHESALDHTSSDSVALEGARSGVHEGFLGKSHDFTSSLSRTAGSSSSVVHLTKRRSQRSSSRSRVDAPTTTSRARSATIWAKRKRIEERRQQEALKQSRAIAPAASSGVRATATGGNVRCKSSRGAKSMGTRSTVTTTASVVQRGGQPAARQRRPASAAAMTKPSRDGVVESKSTAGESAAQKANPPLTTTNGAPRPITKPKSPQFQKRTRRVKSPRVSSTTRELQAIQAEKERLAAERRKTNKFWQTTLQQHEKQHGDKSIAATEGSHDSATQRSEGSGQSRSRSKSCAARTMSPRRRGKPIRASVNTAKPRQLTRPQTPKFRTDERIGRHAAEAKPAVVTGSELSSSSSLSSSLRQRQQQERQRRAASAGPRGPTRPQPFAFRTDRARKAGTGSGKESEELEHGQTVSSKEVAATRSQSVAAAGSSRHRRHKPSSAEPERFVSLAESVALFSSSTRGLAHTAKEAPTTGSTGTTAGSLTEPKPFQFSIEDRLRQRGDQRPKIQSREAQEEEMMRTMPTFKARPWNPNIKHSAGEVGIHRIPKKPLTQPASPEFATSARETTWQKKREHQEDTQDDAQETMHAPHFFHARPMPQYPERPIGQVRSGARLTQPQSPALATTRRAATATATTARVPPASAAAAPPVPLASSPMRPKSSKHMRAHTAQDKDSSNATNNNNNNNSNSKKSGGGGMIWQKPQLTRPEPFELESDKRHVQYETKREAELRKAEEEARKRVMFRARAVGEGVVPLKSVHVPMRPPTQPTPFRLESERRHSEWEAQYQTKLAQAAAEEEASRQFHARPLPRSVASGSGFQAERSHRPLTEPAPNAGRLRSDARAQQWEAFLTERQKREQEEQEKREMEEAQKKREEEEEIRRMRREEMTFKARPVPRFVASGGSGTKSLTKKENQSKPATSGAAAASVRVAVSQNQATVDDGKQQKRGMSGGPRRRVTRSRHSVQNAARMMEKAQRRKVSGGDETNDVTTHKEGGNDVTEEIPALAEESNGSAAGSTVKVGEGGL